jgi:hypothetical protein
MLVGIETIEYMKAKSTPEEFRGHLRARPAIAYIAARVTRRRSVARLQESAVVS